MSEFEPSDDVPSGTHVALPIAEAHVNANLDSIDAIDSKAMFLIGLNVAGVGIYVSAVVALGWGLECTIAPIAFFLIATGIGMWSVWRLKIAQFPSPASIIALLGEHLSDEQVAWVLLHGIAEASHMIEPVLERKARLTLVLLVLTVSHSVAIAGSAAICAG